MGGQQALLQLEQRPAETDPPPVLLDQLQLRLPDRRQRVFADIDVEQLVSDDHCVRAVRELSGKLDLRPFTAQLQTRREHPGRAAWDPRLLIAMWVSAYSEGITSAREIARQCRYRPELEWLCGMEQVNHHTI